MKHFRRIRRVAVLCAAFIAGLVVADRWMTRAVADDVAPQATTAPELSAEVQAVLDRVGAAYIDRPMEMAGELVSDFDVAGMKETRTIRFTSRFRSKETYRHDVEGELAIVANAERVSLLDEGENKYLSTTRPADGGKPTPAMHFIATAIAQQNLALQIAIAGDARVLIGEAADVAVAADVLDGQPCDRLEAARDEMSPRMRVWVDREQGTLLKVEFDFARLLAEQGVRDIKTARATIRYTKQALPDASEFDDDQFVFTPPPGATPMESRPAGGLAAGQEPNALEGAEAPDFTLSDLAGEAVSLAASKGRVVVLDFWASWCGPCRRGMPHLAELARAHDGLVVYAVNQQEDADTVRRFLDEQKLDLVALLDADGAVGKAYGVHGIPQTVVIGQDGRVRKVIVGFSPDLAKQLDEAVGAAIAERSEK